MIKKLGKGQEPEIPGSAFWLQSFPLVFARALLRVSAASPVSVIVAVFRPPSFLPVSDVYVLDHPLDRQQTV